MQNCLQEITDHLRQDIDKVDEPQLRTTSTLPSRTTVSL
jgi:hypothetical protein